MTTLLKLNKKSEQIVKKQLKVKNLIEVIDKDFRELNIINDNDRNLAQKYIARFRGSIRLSNKLFYTKNELDQRQKEIKSLKLP